MFVESNLDSYILQHNLNFGIKNHPDSGPSIM